MKCAARSALAGLWLCLLLCASTVARAAPYGPFNRPQDDWRVAETRYFRFYFTDQTPATTAHLMAIADETFERLNRFYRYEPPRKITVTVVGYTSYSNGFADSLRNRITIFPTPPDFYTRSRVPWLDNVFTHELSHILSLNAATYWFSRVPLVLGTGVARTDTTQTLVRAPIYGRNYPHWFIEGVAQFDTERLGRDSFDENRAAYQRAALEDGMLFPLGKTAFFGGEQWYNSGLSFLKFLEDKFGKGTVHRLFREYGERYYYVFDGLFEDVLGQPLTALEAEFRAELDRRFTAHRAAMAEGLYDGKPLVYEEQEEAYWELSSAQRDYRRDSYRSSPLRFSRGKLFFSQGGVIQYADFSPTERTLTNTEALGQGSAVAENGPDSFFMLKPGEELSLWPYVYRPDFESARLVVVDTEGEERELLHESRLMDFDVCEGRSELAGVYNDGDGSLRLALYPIRDFGRMDVAIDGEPRFLLPERPFDEVRSPRYSPDCKKLLFSRRIGRDHDLFAYDFASGSIETISAESAFELYPAPARDGVYYVSARDESMSIYFRRYDGGPARRITAALTGHHNPVASPDGLFFARLYGTGFQTHFQPKGWRASEPPVELIEKQSAPLASPAHVDAPAGEPYNGFSPANILSPSFVPMLDVELDSQRSYGDSLRAQAGLEMFIEDQLGRHALLFRGYLGNRNSFLLDYQNDMLPVSLRVRGGMTDTRSLYVFRDDDSSFEHVTDYRWGFLTGSVGLPLNFYYRLTALADTVRDIGTAFGARGRSYDWFEPRYGRNLYGLRVDYRGIDRNDPTFRERDVNKRGYRESDLGVFYGQEEVHPLVAEAVEGLSAGVSPYFRGELHHTEYLALPALWDGFFDHTLQIDAQVGFISRDIRFLPFLGGGRLYALTTPELNTSVGFVGYDFYSVRGETLLNLALSYRFPLARNLAWDWGPLYLEDIYAQVFTSWGNIWGFDADGERQLPFRDRAENGRYVLGDVGIDLRFWNFFQEVDTNVGATLRAVYRLVPFTACPEEDVSENPSCLGVNADPGPMFYFLLGGGF